MANKNFDVRHGLSVKGVEVIDGNGNVVGGALGAVSTSNVSEGTNLYFTDARARSALSAGTGISYNSSTGAISLADTGLVSGVTAGSGLTGGGASGNVTLNIGAGTGISVAADSVSVNMGAFDTGDLSEGTNLYFTAARARGNISAGGDLSYNASTGVMSFTERTDAEVRGLLSGGTGITYNSTTGEISLTDTGYITGVTAGSGLTGGAASGTATLNVGAGQGITVSADSVAVNTTYIHNSFSAGGDLSYSNGTYSFTQRTDAQVRALVSASGDLSYNSSTGVFSFTERTDAEVRGLVSASGDLSYNSSTGVFSFSETYSSASELLTAIKTVDGSGSGLDADTIDGVQLSNIARTDIAETFTSDLTVGGNLVVSGTTTTVNTETINLADNIILLNSNATGAPSQNSGIEIERGDSTNKQLIWDEALDRWTVGGETFSAGTLLGNLAWSSITGKPDPVVTVTLTGDVTGTASATLLDLASNTVTVSTTIAANSVALGTDTTGNYVGTITAGTGLSSSGATTGEGVAHTLSLAPAGVGAGTYGSTSLATKIEEITVDAYGRITAITTGATGDIQSVAAGDGLTGGGNMGLVILDIGAGNGITVNPDNVAVDMSVFSTTDLSEGTNQYFTTARARGAISGGTGISYNSSTGVISLTDTGYVTGVTAGLGLSGGGTDGTVTLNVDLSELTDMTAAMTGTDEFIVLDAGADRRKAANEIGLSIFNNDAGFTTNVGDITNVAVSGTGLSGGGSSGAVTITSNATSANTAGTIVARDGSGNFAAGVITATATSARYADLAEKYATDADYEPGTVVCFGGDAEVTACAHEAHHAVAGVISTDPAYMMNSEADGQYVALAGRVPCKVTGPVAKGDLLVSSSVPGHAKADNNAQAGRIIGKAIGSSEGGEAVIEVLVNMM